MDKELELTPDAIQLLSGILNFKVLAWYEDDTVVYGMDYRSTPEAVKELIGKGYIELFESLDMADIYKITELGESKVIRKK